jgi:hypothetical protein
MDFSSLNSSQWQWQTCNNLPFLTCNLLADWQHGFFTKHFQGQSPSILAKCLNPSTSVFQVKQIHSNIILNSTEIKSLSSDTDNQNDKIIYPEGDGIITNQPLESVWCASADCTPVLIADSYTGKVAAIHSGWRGTASQIVPNAIAILQDQGSSLDNLLFALGPAIHGKVYQVETKVAIEVLKTIVKDISSPEVILQQGYEFDSQLILPDSEAHKIKLNVTQVINLQIQQKGISPSKIAIAPYCTYQDSDYFFSYRRTKEKNIQWSGIVSNYN